MRIIDIILVSFIFCAYITIQALNTDTGSSGSGIEEIPAWTSQLHKNETTPDILYEDIPMGYQTIKIYYENFNTIYKNDFNINYKFKQDKINNSDMTLRVIRVLFGVIS